MEHSKTYSYERVVLYSRCSVSEIVGTYIEAPIRRRRPTHMGSSRLECVVHVGAVGPSKTGL